MQGYLAVATLILLFGMVWLRVLLLRRGGVNAMHFGKLDGKDFLIPPFALFYFYLVLAAAFDLPTVNRQTFFESGAVAWLGVLFCAAGLVVLLSSLVSFGRSFRVGIDTATSDRLVTTGIFAVSRNPIYVAFGLVLLGELLVFPNWILLAYLAAALWLIHRQVLREEEFLAGHYRQQFAEYRARVRRYV